MNIITCWVQIGEDLLYTKRAACKILCTCKSVENCIDPPTCLKTTSVTHSLVCYIHSHKHSHTHPLTHPLTPFSLIQSHITHTHLTFTTCHSPIHSLTHSLTHSHTRSLTHSLTFTHIHSPTHSLTHSTHPPTHSHTSTHLVFWRPSDFLVNDRAIFLHV